MRRDTAILAFIAQESFCKQEIHQPQEATPITRERLYETGQLEMEQGPAAASKPPCLLPSMVTSVTSPKESSPVHDVDC